MRMTFSADEAFACQLDAEDPLRHFRERFHLPLGADGKPLIYLAGNSLGPMPKAARQIVEQELDDWSTLAVDAHLDGTRVGGAARRRAAERSHLHEQPHGQSSPNDGDFLSANEIEK